MRSRRRWSLYDATALVVLIGVAAAALRHGGDVTPMRTTGTVSSADGTTIAFTQLGHGPPLVLVDGALCFRENGPSSDLAKALGSSFTVYAYDRRGRGESSDAKPYAIAREIEDLNAMIRQAGDSAFVFGSSSGAALALHAAAAGAPIRKLALYEPPIGAVRPGGPPLDEARREVDRLVTAGDSASAARYFLTAMLGTPAIAVTMMRFLMRGTWTKVISVAHTLPYDLAILADESLADEHRASVSIPTLVIGGEKSPAFMQETVKRVARTSNGTALLLPGQSHDVSAAATDLAVAMRSFFMRDP